MCLYSKVFVMVLMGSLEAQVLPQQPFLVACQLSSASSWHSFFLGGGEKVFNGVHNLTVILCVHNGIYEMGNCLFDGLIIVLNQ